MTHIEGGKGEGGEGREERERVHGERRFMEGTLTHSFSKDTARYYISNYNQGFHIPTRWYNTHTHIEKYPQRYHI